MPYDLPSGSYFGYKIVIKNNKCLIGADSADEGESNSTGVLYQYKFIDGYWEFEAKHRPYILTPHYFGVSCAFHGDNILVGASAAAYFGGGSGCVYYISTEDPFDYSFTQIINHPYPEDYDWFGSVVDIYGDTCVVGCYKDDDGYFGSTDWGSVYVYLKDSYNILSLQQKITSEGHQHPDHRHDSWFGWAVSLYQDTLLIGCPYDKCFSLIGLMDIGILHKKYLIQMQI